MTLLVFEFSKLALRWLSSAHYTYTVAYWLIIITWSGFLVQQLLMACLHGAIVAAIGRATDRRDRLHVCLHDAIVAAIGRATIVWL